ncbi:fimbrial-like protein [Salmonella enterica]|nr:fimbrial-like protein [Salmonella enterica]
MFKKTLLAMAATSLFSGVAFNAFADQGHGTVTFTGTVITAPCSIAPGDEDLKVNLGEVADSVLNGGKYSMPADFTIHLQDCVFTSTTDEETSTTTVTPSKVEVTFTSNKVDSTDTSLLANSLEGNYGAASNVGVRILDAGSNEVTLGTPVSVTFLDTNSYQELNFHARMESPDKDVTEGNVYAQANYVLAYK